MHFYKYQGTGNDFIIIDNRQGNNSELQRGVIHKLCDRRFGIGADGFMLLNNIEDYDFEMNYYNADGRPGSMCGNGGRCIVRFAHDLGIHKTEYKFLAVDGPHFASLNDKGIVSLKMSNVHNIEKCSHHYILNTGSPHYVKEVTNIAHFDVYNEGKKIRYSDEFKEVGINVNFVEVFEDDSLRVRTYERGVEDETFSCGTGVTAAALVFYHNDNGFNSVDVHTQGGNLNVSYQKNIDGSYSDIWLTGPATKVYEGDIFI